MDPTTLLWHILFGAIGSGYLIYGKKQSAIIPALSGLCLIVSPYFIENLVFLIILGTALIATPFIIKN